MPARTGPWREDMQRMLMIVMPEAKRKNKTDRKKKKQGRTRSPGRGVAPVPCLQKHAEMFHAMQSGDTQRVCVGVCQSPRYIISGYCVD